MTSHAAVVARGMGTCCVSGCGDIAMDEENKKYTLAGKEFHEGDYISIDGTTGNIYDGAIKTVDATIAGEFGRVMAWADKSVSYTHLHVAQIQRIVIAGNTTMCHLLRGFSCETLGVAPFLPVDLRCV